MMALTALTASMAAWRTSEVVRMSSRRRSSAGIPAAAAGRTGRGAGGAERGVEVFAREMVDEGRQEGGTVDNLWSPRRQPVGDFLLEQADERGMQMPISIRRGENVDRDLAAIERVEEGISKLDSDARIGVASTSAQSGWMSTTEAMNDRKLVERSGSTVLARNCFCIRRSTECDCQAAGTTAWAIDSSRSEKRSIDLERMLASFSRVNG